MPTFAIKTEITDAQAVELLRGQLESEPVEVAPKFKRGDAVRLDTGNIGVVHSVELDGGVNVIYLTDDGEISSPSFGYDLELLSY